MFLLATEIIQKSREYLLVTHGFLLIGKVIYLMCFYYIVQL
ncbi:hypothetical protein EUBSIR_01391 [[Eubacterium] siraeum DSM 15702]|uniref:Uncharacterized protein n=1 Tax=[Eubacterium] siraeum DSM 15702 TaxID=428128 RepID=B0MNI6_9FIRM|nr:hypothetical protein EUBSIR_01391 [[Eubacterium] siraeum DSM 15702]